MYQKVNPFKLKLYCFYATKIHLKIYSLLNSKLKNNPDSYWGVNLLIIFASLKNNNRDKATR